MKLSERLRSYEYELGTKYAKLLSDEAEQLEAENAALKRENERLLPFLGKAREAKADGWASISMRQMVEEYDNAKV